jgi:spore germination protein GerM
VVKRKTNKKANSKGSQAIVIFWLVFVIVIICVFMANASTIQKNFNLFKTRITAPVGSEEDLLADEEDTVETLVLEQQQQPQRSTPEQPTTPPAPVEPPKPQTPEPQRPATPPTQPQTQQQTQPPTPPAQTRDRAIYFTNIGSDGQILHSRVTRRITVSDSPMQDSLNALLAGPSAEEVGRGIINLIPQNTRVISATVRGNTAYINFSEDFLFNTFGVEGYVAQLRQIVWTVTEFQNVRDVQILIEGRRIDYLGEGIWIGSPISRQSF